MRSIVISPRRRTISLTGIPLRPTYTLRHAYNIYIVQKYTYLIYNIFTQTAATGVIADSANGKDEGDRHIIEMENNFIDGKASTVGEHVEVYAYFLYCAKNVRMNIYV